MYDGVRRCMDALGRAARARGGRLLIAPGPLFSRSQAFEEHLLRLKGEAEKIRGKSRDEDPPAINIIHRAVIAPSTAVETVCPSGQNRRVPCGLHQTARAGSGCPVRWRVQTPSDIEEDYAPWEADGQERRYPDVFGNGVRGLGIRSVLDEGNNTRRTRAKTNEGAKICTCGHVSNVEKLSGIEWLKR